MELFDLSGKTALITGASRGIGKAIAFAFGKAGAQIVISSRKQESLDAVQEELQASGINSIGIACHVGKTEELENLVEMTKSHFGGMDILVNNAATNPVFAPLEQITPLAFEKIISVNLKAPFELSNLCHPIMKERCGGSIINIASVEGMKPSMGLGVYRISKAALIMLTKSQAKEWGKDGIRANALCPGLIKTQFSAALWQNEAILKRFTQNIPQQRMAEPEEMVGAALYFASQASSYTTGSVLSSDGGYLVS